MRRWITGAGLFVLGACAGTAVHTLADVPAPAPAAVGPVSSVSTAASRVVRWAPSGKASITELARGANAFVGILTIEGGAAIPQHHDATEEYIHVLTGSGTITIDGTAHPVAPGDTVFMAADAEVSFQNGEAPMRTLQVFAGPSPASKYDPWAERPAG